MKNKIHYSPESRRDLDDIWDYIVLELQNRSAAERVIDHIMNAVDPLKNFAEMGTPLSSIADVGTDYRFLVSGNYMVFYRVQGCDVIHELILERICAERLGLGLGPAKCAGSERNR